MPMSDLSERIVQFADMALAIHIEVYSDSPDALKALVSYATQLKEKIEEYDREDIDG